MVRDAEGCDWATLDGDRGAVLFDGYLFDRRTLATELGLRAEAVNDSALIAAAYERWGAAIFDRLDGCYLIAVWDAAADRLLLGHDALGRHPVFYAIDRGTVWFGPNLLGLASGSGLARTPNRLSLALAFLLYWPEAGQTFFDRIRRVRPGHYLDVRGAGLQVSEQKFWDPLPAEDESWIPDSQVHDAFEPALAQAVARCMDLGAQGIMLSGGVDSVTVAALAARYGTGRGQAPLVAVSGQTGGPLSSEERMQSAVSVALGMPHLVSTTPEWRDGRDDVSLSLEEVRELPAPDHTWWVGTYTRFYRRTAAERLHLLLTGAGGDNWLGVADAHAADLLRRGHVVQLARFIKATACTGGASWSVAARRLLWVSGVRPHLDSLWSRLAPAHKQQYHRRTWMERLPAWVCPDAALREELVDRLIARRTPSLTSSGRAPRSHYLHGLRSLDNPYLHHENETAYHIEMACGLRLLSPYHDRQLVSFFNRISPRALVHGGRYKGLLRPIVARHLPNLGLENQRKEYSTIEAERQLVALRRTVAEAWATSHLHALGRLDVIDSPRARRDIEGWHERHLDHLARMFALMSADRWVSVHTTA